jgi:hypothetical protein
MQIARGRNTIKMGYPDYAVGNIQIAIGNSEVKHCNTVAM